MSMIVEKPGEPSPCSQQSGIIHVAEKETMTKLDFYGIDEIGLAARDEVLPGRLIVIEGTDGVGRTTQLHLLRPWLESLGYGVVDTEMTRSVLAGPGLKQAKEGHTL